MQHMRNIFVEWLGREPHDYSYLGLAIFADSFVSVNKILAGLCFNCNSSPFHLADSWRIIAVWDFASMWGII